MDQKAALVEVVRGQCPPNRLPDSKSRTVRVYLSATPDMAPERTAIQRFVYPKLKLYCAGKYGIDFQFVELQWGVEESTGYLNSDLDIMKSEINTCTDKSIGPAFLVIEKDHYELIAERMEKEGEGSGAILEKYYTLDPHGEEPVYRLQRDNICSFNSESAKSREGRTDGSQFKRTFRRCVFQVASEGLYTEDVKRKYTPTVFETEVEAGLQDSAEKLKGRAVCLVRTVRDLDHHQDDLQHGRFCDVIDGAPDEEMQSRLLNIREIEVRQRLPGSNLKKVTTDWETVSVAVDRRADDFRMAKYAQRMRPPQAPALRLLKHEDYLHDICQKVQSQLKQLIDRAAAPLAIEKHTAIDKVYAEVIQHWRMVRDLAGRHSGDDYVSNVIKYIEDETPFTCIIHGDDAVMRSAVSSKASVHSPAKLDSSSLSTNMVKPFTIVRNISTFQQHDQNLKHLLLSLCRQIYLLYQRDWTESSDLDQLKKDFEVCIKDFPTSSSPLHLFLDGLELLGLLESEELGLAWIPENLQQNVKLVVTCPNANEELLQGLSVKAPYQSLMVDLDGINLEDEDDEERMEALDGYKPPQKADNNHTGPEQEQLTSTTSGTSHLIDVVSKGLQTAGITTCSGGLTLAGAEVLQVWIKYLEKRHDKAVISAVFRLLSLSNRGLTECELLDLLSLDDELLNEGVFLGSQPLLRRFPGLLWARLKADLSAVLQISDTDNRDVISWSLPEMKGLCLSTFINKLNPATKMHQHMTLYFMGIAAKPRPIDDCNSSVASDGLSPREVEVRVDAQPSVFENPDSIYSTVNYNLRKLSELPHHLLHGRQIDELLRHVIFNYKWLYSKLNATSPSELISVLMVLAQSDNLKEHPDVLKLLKVLQDSFLFLKESPECLRAELTGRLLNFLGNSNLLTSLIRQCDDEGYLHCPITPLNATFEDRQDEVRQIIPCETGYYEELYVAAVPFRKEVITYTVPEKLCLWNSETADQLMEFECNQYTYCTDIRVSRNGVNVLALNNGKPKQSFLENSAVLNIFDLDTGKRLRHIRFRESTHKPKRLFRVLGLNERRIMFDTPTYAAVCVDIVRLCNIKTGQELAKLQWPFLVTPDERFLVMTEHDGHRLVLRSMPEMTHVVRKLTSPKNITAIMPIVTPTSLSILVAAGSMGILSKYDLDDVGDDPNAEPLEPVKRGILVEQKDSSMKGGCGRLILSKDNIYLLAVYIYATEGRDLYRTNFVLSTETLENIHIFESAVKDYVQFSPDGKHIVHLKEKNGVLDVIEIDSGNVIATYQAQGQIRKICRVTEDDGNACLVVTKKELQILDLDRLIERGKREKDEVESDISDAGSVEYNTPRTRLRTLSADVPLSAVMTPKAIESIPVKLTQINEASGEVKSANMNLLKGVHFADSEMPSYLIDARVTPSGRRFIVTFEQMYIMASSKKGEKKVLCGPLKDDFSQTKITGGMTGVGTSRDVFGVGMNALSSGMPLQKGSKIYSSNDTRRNTIFEAEGGETIQRCPSVIRIFHAETGDCIRAIQVKNEKLLACTDNHVVTASGDGDFTNIYSIDSGGLASTLDVPPSSAVFVVDDSCLVIVPARRHACVLHIYTGTNYLDVHRCDLSEGEGGELSIWEVMTCSRSAASILVSLLGERAGQEDAHGINYAWVDVTYASIIRQFSCFSELVQLSPDGSVGVDSEFRFYDLQQGQVLFRVSIDNVTLTEHASFITDEGRLMVFLDNEKGQINVIDLGKKKLLSRSFFHPTRSKLSDGLRSLTHDVASLIPLHGGMQMVVLDGTSVKQFLLQTTKKQLLAMGMVKLRKHGFDSAGARTQYYHSVNADGGIELTRRTNHKVMHRSIGGRGYGKRK